MSETAAGRMARTMPELGRRELSALMCENAHREISEPRWRDANERSAVACVMVRAGDARALGWAKHHAAALGMAAGECAAYWAALP